MTEVFPYGPRTLYPHMKPRDIAIWQRFLAAYPTLYNTVQYDVHVGETPDFIDDIEEELTTKQNRLYQLKIDVVAFGATDVDIIEVKPDASPSTIGQVQGYRSLYVRDVRPGTNVGLVIVTDVERPNMRYLCQTHGVKLIIV